jgi:hypothetical protein
VVRTLGVERVDVDVDVDVVLDLTSKGPVSLRPTPDYRGIRAGSWSRDVTAVLGPCRGAGAA